MIELAHGVTYSTCKAFDEIEDWLVGHCKGTWQVQLIDMDERLVRKKFEIRFEKEADKRRFVKRMTRTESAAA